jgi:hypothetical protein
VRLYLIAHHSTMPLRAPVPHDIVAEFINYLPSDPQVLKCCSIISRTFQRISRKHLVSCITLDAPDVASALLRSLNSSLEIPTFFVPNLSVFTIEFLQVVDSASRVYRFPTFHPGRTGTFPAES